MKDPTGDPTTTTTTTTSPYVEMDRAAWARLRRSTPLTLSVADLAQLSGLGDPVDLSEVTEVYLPLSRLLNLYMAATRELHAATSTFSARRHRVRHS